MPPAKNIRLSLVSEAIGELPPKSGTGGGPMPETVAFIKHLGVLFDTPGKWHLVATGSSNDIQRLSSRLYGMREHGTGQYSQFISRFTFEKRLNGESGSFYARYDEEPEPVTAVVES